MIGKSFDIDRSSTGELLGMSGTDELQYRVGPFGLRSIETDFGDFFPALPDRPVKVGDTWNSTTVIADVRDATITYELTSVNTFRGVETVDGVECAKITAAVSGEMTGEARDKGTDITFKGIYDGSDVWYFAYKEGRLVSRDSRGSVSGEAFDERGNQGQGMTVPLNREISTTIELVR